MPVSTLTKDYPEEYFNKLCAKNNIPTIFGYYAWLLNEGTGAGEDIINSLIEFRESCVKGRR